MHRSIVTSQLERLGVIERQSAELDVERVHLIAEAHGKGASWDEIGRALGVSRQSAWETYRLRVASLHAAASLHTDADEEDLLESAAASLKRARARRHR